jgi:hypothetical protein
VVYAEYKGWRMGLGLGVEALGGWTDITDLDNRNNKLQKTYNEQVTKGYFQWFADLRS